MIHMRDDILEEDMPPRRRFVHTVPPPRCDVVESSAAAARLPRERGGWFFKALQASEHRMMTSIKEVNLRISYQAQGRTQESEDFYIQLHDAQTDRRDIRLEIDVVRGQRTTYKTELHERQSPEDLAVRDMMYDASQSSSGGLRRLMQPARVCSYTDFIKCQPLNFKGTKGVVGLSQWLKKMESVFHISGCAVDNQVKFATCTLIGAALTWWNGHVRTLGHDAAYAMTWGTLKKKLKDKYCPKELALMRTKFLVDETKKVDKYISGLPDNIRRNVMSTRPKTLDDAIELANDLMDQKLRTYAERQNDNKRKVDDSSRNNQQQPHKKQNVARAYTDGPGKKKAYTGNLPLCTKCNYHHIRQCAPKCGNCKRYGHTTSDCRVNTNNNNNKNQKAGACYKCAQGRAYALGGRDASPDSNIITGFTLNFMNHPFYIDLMRVPLSSFDVIIGMDWLTKYHGVIICDEKIVLVPFRREMLIFQGDGNNQREESRLNIISCTKAQEYLSKGCDVFLAHITTKEAKYKSERKRLEDVPMVGYFPEVFPKDFSGSTSSTSKVPN
uniref:Retrotransposon gag domain-containing protein n=1 Tax=Tanacetum cinerariifolium TaxID=118510 RepID=A0A699HMS9_TANCI|nr:hypothetical protein [Tanacetum cinerariifolium]